MTISSTVSNTNCSIGITSFPGAVAPHGGWAAANREVRAIERCFSRVQSYRARSGSNC
jgi:heme O synthase-like polyprenyltransferase